MKHWSLMNYRNVTSSLKKKKEKKMHSVRKAKENLRRSNKKFTIFATNTFEN